MRDLAELPRSACAGTDLAEAVDHLSWLCPAVSSLATLSRSPAPTTWADIRDDPGAVLLTLRQPGTALAERIDSPSLFDEINRHLDADRWAFVDWTAPGIAPILRTGTVCASFAESLARKSGNVDPERAWACGLLTPLGFYAASAVNPDSVAACLADPELTKEPAETQRRHWGIDAAALARRIARRWGLPDWLTTIIGHLALTPQPASELGADLHLFRVTRLAVGLARRRGFDLGGTSDNTAEDAAALGLTAENLECLETPPVPTHFWQDPRQAPLLRDLLAVAAENRRLRDSTLRRRTEIEADRLHEVLERQAGAADQRLRESKLAAMAEFAAGAGHEINNPLAVISGQAQYLLAHGAEWFTTEAADAPRKSLQAVITQTKRIHHLLRDMMQFARPAPPRPSRFDLAEVLAESAALVRELAEQRHVRLDVHLATPKVIVHADREQVKAALTNVLRNAVEAAPAEGWARVSIAPPAAGRVALAVEDNGPGPDETKRDHLFDPFYSGRCAGRGRGLGLPTAWRLIRLQGGDVRLDPPHADAPTRFILEMPCSPAEPDPATVAAPAVFTETVGLHGHALNNGHPVKG